MALFEDIDTEPVAVRLTICPRCDRRRCVRCSRQDPSGVAARCADCGGELSLTA